MGLPVRAVGTGHLQNNNGERMTTIAEKFLGAALSLARSGAIKDRLSMAYREHLADLEQDELPQELRAQFESVTRALTRERPLFRGEDAVRASVRKMSNDEADACACSIVQLYGALPRTTLMPVARAGAPVVQLFAAEA